MDIDFDIVKDTIKTVALRLDSPASKYNFVFSESDTAVEVCIEDSNSIDPLFVFVVDAERFRVLKALDLDPDGYVSFPYHSYVELLSFIIEHFYPVFFKLTGNGLITDMLSRLLGKRVRVWKDLLRLICESGQVEFTDRGKVFNVMGTNFWYNSNSHILSVSGELNDEYKCPTVMELAITLLTVVAYIFKLNEVDANPILGVQELEQGDDSLFEEEMDMGEDIDSMDMGGGDIGGDLAGGEDLSAEFAPAGDSIENTAPGIEEGKGEIMDEVLEASYRPGGVKRSIQSLEKPTLVESASSVTRETEEQMRQEKNLIASMAYLDSPDKINYGGSSPFYVGKNQKGSVVVPSELKVIQDLNAIRVQVVYYEGAKPSYKGKPYSFSIGIYGCQNLATIITIRYGAVFNNKSLSGVVGVDFALNSDNKLFDFDIRDPHRFSLAELVSIFNAGVDSINQFVLDNASLSSRQRELVSESGVY